MYVGGILGVKSMSWQDYKDEMRGRFIFIAIVIVIFAIIALVLALLGVEPPN